MENLKNLEKIAKIFQPQNIITSDEIDQVLKGIMDILASYKKGTDSINEETKAVVNSLLEQTIKYNQETISDFKSEAEKAHSERMKELQGFLSEVKTTLGDMEVMMSEVKDGKDADEERVIEEVINRIKIDPTVVTMSAEEVRDKLASLKGEDRLDKSAIKGLEKVLQQKDLDYAVATLQQQASFLINKGGLKNVTAGTNVTIDYTDPSNPVISATGGSGSGDVTGPASSTDNALARFDGTTGKIIQNSTGTLDDSGILSVTSGIITGTNGAGHINLRHQASDATATGQSTAIFADSNGDFKYKNDGNYYTTLKTSTNTADRTYTYPDATGTLALKNGLTTNQIAYASDTNTVSSLDTATYPSLTELSYAKGVTSAIQTQLNAKEPTITTLAVNKGGTGQTTYTNGQLLIGNTTGNTLTKATLTGTSNQVVVTNGGGSITLSTPQDIGTSSNPQFATIELGAASDTTLSRSSAGVLAVEGVVIPSISSTNTLTNKRITKRVNSDTSNSATPTLNTDNYDMNIITGQTNNITSMTTNLSGTPTSGQTLWFALTAGSGTPTITWGSSFEDSTETAPTALSTTRQDVGFVWNATTSKWRCVAKC